jgi:hypothetical protein
MKKMRGEKLTLMEGKERLKLVQRHKYQSLINIFTKLNNKHDIKLTLRKEYKEGEKKEKGVPVGCSRRSGPRACGLDGSWWARHGAHGPTGSNRVRPLKRAETESGFRGL